MSFTLVIGNKNYSSWSLRAWLVLRRAGARFDEIVVPLDQPTTAEDIARHSPSGRLPVLRDGGLVVWESLAIAEYAAERFPDAALWPEDVVLRAAARSVSAEVHAGLPALREHMPFNARRLSPGKGQHPEALADVKRVLVLWKTCLRSFAGGGPFLFGRFSIADAMFAPVVSRFVTYGVEVDAASRAYMDAVLALPEMNEWMEAARAEPHALPRYDL